MEIYIVLKRKLVYSLIMECMILDFDGIIISHVSKYPIETWPWKIPTADTEPKWTYNEKG